MNQTTGLSSSSTTDKASVFYKKFFLFAAFWNVGAGLMGILSLSLNIKLFYNVNHYSGDHLFKLHYYNFWLFILIMGIGFYFVSKNVAHNYAMAIVGILGKTLAVGMWLYYYFTGKATYMVLIASAGDMLLVLVFIIYLRFTLKNYKNQKLLNPKSPPMMNVQDGLTLLFNTRKDKMQDLIELLNTISENIEENELMPFDKMKKIHFSRWVMMDATTDVDGNPIPAHLLFESDYDGVEADHINEMLDVALPGFIKIFRTCEGFTENENVTRDEVLAFMNAHNAPKTGLFIGAWGRSVKQIKQEKTLYCAIENYLDENRDALVTKSPLDIRNKVREFVWSKPELAWAQVPPGKRSFEQNLQYYGYLAYLICCAIILSPILIVMVITALIMLRRQELKEPPTDHHLDKSKVSLLQKHEKFNLQNQFSAVGNIKPGTFRLRFLKKTLWMINRVSRYVFNKGMLATIPSIHFARWVFLDNHKRLIFISNYDGTSDQYLTDFVNKQPAPMSAIFCHMMDFPKTKWLVLEGARDMKGFVAWARKKQIPSQVWYSAYKDLTVKNIIANTKIRMGLYETMNDKKAQQWLNLL